MSNKYKTILELSNQEAKKYFLEAKNYCSLDLPEYIDFQPLIDNLEEKIDSVNFDSKSINKFKKKAATFDDVNYQILTNKDGNYQWRPISIIHPVLYIYIVNLITDIDNWKVLVDRFNNLRNPHLNCCSIPIVKSSKKNIVSNWYENFEQTIIENYIDYQWMGKTDITNFYSSIYTQSISWAIIGKDVAKQNKNKKDDFYNKIDSFIQSMQYGQTNGIPQGSVLMDFFAELILAYVDNLAVQKININDYLIIRYRDDYRILTKSKSDVEIILKELSTVLSELNIKLNTAKTAITSDIILDAIKPEKLNQMRYPINMHTNFEKILLNILLFEKEFPNNGYAIKLLNEFVQKLRKCKKISKIPQLLNINTQLMINYPRNYKSCAAIFSVLFSKMSQNAVLEYIDRILLKNSERPYSDYLEIWLQRISLPYYRNKQYTAKICKKITGDEIDIWNSRWIELKVNENLFICEEAISNLDKIISQKEIDYFSEY